MKKIIMAMLILATMLQAKDYRTQEEKCREIRVDLIRVYQRFLESAVTHTTLYMKRDMEDLISKLEKYPKACEFTQFQQQQNRQNLGFIKSELKKIK